ncbi:trigger factor [Candidatus Enterovibrio escicola]|uniref:Trigger factor n=1 Tax=Candidatus Enterovibrio escicola TaxID=1927127 RepID=A0A2A5T0G6_9GAMM|nr:trigger factor [Candidatus Enterovibrio escacola]PCS21652.1 Cell division trigger factor [Candidatus Enterovibrio escacola]
MQVTVETIEKLKLQLTITVLTANIEDIVTTELRNITRNRRFDGFRKGKVPFKMVSRMYRKAVHSDVLGELMQRHFMEAIIKEKIKPAGRPTFTPIEIEYGKDLVFKASFEIYPVIDLKDLDKVEVVKPHTEITDEDVVYMIETLRKQQTLWVDVDSVVEENSRVTIDFTGSINGDTFEGGKAENFVLIMGKNSMIPNFEDELVGKKVGDEFTIEVNLPENYPAEPLKGKTAKFYVKLRKVEMQELPELTDEFVARFGIQEGGVEVLKTEVRRNMEREMKQAIKILIKEQVINGLVKHNSIDVPSTLIDQEINILCEQVVNRFGEQMKNTPELSHELVEEQAKYRVVVGLLLGEVIKSENLNAEEARVKELIIEIASAYEDPSEVVAYYEKDQRMMENMRNLALEEQAIDVLLVKAQVSNKKQSFFDLMNSVQA